MPTLFSDRVRVDRSPAEMSEDMLSFFDRVDQPYWAEVRALLETWFAELPPSAQGELRPRFHSGDYDAILSAFWELFLHALLIRSDFTVTPHPKLDGATRTPDFRVEAGGDHFYVEAAIVTEPRGRTARGRLLGRVYDAINAVESPDFWVNLRLKCEGSSPPPTSQLQKALETWLAELDYDELVALTEVGRHRELPQRNWRVRDWWLELTFSPKLPRGSSPTIGFYPAEGGAFDPRAEILPTLRKKASHYGQLDGPFVIAVLCDNVFADADDVSAALFGRTVARYEGAGEELRYVASEQRRDALFQPTRGTRVSAVLTTTQLKPWMVARSMVQLWRNPWAARPIAPRPR